MADVVPRYVATMQASSDHDSDSSIASGAGGGKIMQAENVNPGRQKRKPTSDLADPTVTEQ